MKLLYINKKQIKNIKIKTKIKIKIKIKNIKIKIKNIKIKIKTNKKNQFWKIAKIDSFLPACSSCINYKNDDYKTLIIGMVCAPDTWHESGKQVQNIILWRNGQDKNKYTEFQDQICDGEFLQETCETEWHERRVY